MIHLTEYDDFGTLNGHAIIGDWIAFLYDGKLCTGRITGVERTGLTRTHLIPRQQDCMVIDDGEYRLTPADDDWNQFDVVKITLPCMNHCCHPEMCTMRGCMCFA